MRRDAGISATGGTSVSARPVEDAESARGAATHSPQTVAFLLPAAGPSQGRDRPGFSRSPFPEAGSSSKVKPAAFRRNPSHPMPAPPFHNYHVRAAEHGQTLAAFLRAARAGTSWNQAKRFVQKRYVQVNGNLCTDEARRLKTGDVVKVWRDPVPGVATPQDLRLVYFDRHLVVVDKPSGVTSVRHHEERNWPARRKQFQPTLDELLPAALARRGGTPAARRDPSSRLPRVRPVHRLDRDTSGLMVFARTPAAEQGLIQQFRQHVNERVYLAIAVGDVPAMTIDSHLVEDRGDGRRGSTTLPNVGKRAVTHVEPLATTGEFTLLRCRLETGRTHQIRIHLAEQGHPICGDKIYNHGLGGRPIVDRSGAPRHALHAAELGFTHPVTGEQLKFATDLPADLQRLWDRLSEKA